MTKLNSHEKEMVKKLEKMSVPEAKRALANKGFGDIGSQNYYFCLAWIEARESEEKEGRDQETLRFARHAAYAAYIAAIIAIISVIITIIIA
jgi:hypothetical protein